MPALTNLSLFDEYAGRGNAIVIAVSGGGDSIALLDLYRQSPTLNLPKPFVVTIDHSLRAGFAVEAAIVEAYCRAYNLSWQLLRWDGEKPKTGIMAAARLARYSLLAEAATAVGARIILTGHTLDDQIETMRMRGARGAASYMERDVLFERRVWISRPLLEISRLELRAHLALNNIAFADDPTNDDLRFERGRVRKETFREATPLPTIVGRKDLALWAAAFIEECLNREGDVVTIQRPLAHDFDTEAFALRYLAAALGGFDYPAPKTVGVELADLLNTGSKGDAFTAQRCVFKRIAGGVSVSPEARHAERPWLNAKIQPFESFCPKSMVPLANALAAKLNAPEFILP